MSESFRVPVSVLTSNRSNLFQAPINSARNNILPKLYSERMVSSANSDGDSIGSPRSKIADDLCTPQKTLQTSNMKLRKIQTCNISPRDYVRVSTGQDNTDHIQSYHLENTWVSNLEKPKANAFPKEKNSSFIQSIVKGNASKLGPGHYKPVNADTFVIDAKRIHFPISKAARTTVFEEHAKNRSWVPSASIYDVKRQDRVIGSEKS